MKRTNRFLLPILMICCMLIFGCALTASAASQDPTLSTVQVDKNVKTVSSAKGLGAPYLISAKAKDYKSIRLVWTPSLGSSGYYVYYSTSANGTYKKIATLKGAFTYGAVFTNCRVGQTYYFRLKAYKGSTTSSFSRALSAKTVDARTTLSVKKYGTSGAKLTWTAVNGATGYQVYRATGNSTSYKKMTTTTSLSYINTGLKANTYRYAVRAVYKINGSYCYGSFCSTKSIKITAGTSSASTKYRALLVGNADYPGTLNDLRGPVNDVKVMKGMLTGMKTPYTCVTRNNQTKSQILSLISSSFSQAKATDVSLFYYSGHGYTSSGSTSGGLFTADQQCLTTQELANALNKIPGHIIVILDSCGSGAAVSTKGASASFDANVFASSVYSAFASADATAKSNAKAGELATSKYTVIAAAAPRTSCLELTIDGYPAGYMTYALAKGAGCSYPNGSYSCSMPADKNSNGRLTLAEIYTYVHGIVGREQTTTVYPSTSSSYNVLLRK